MINGDTGLLLNEKNIKLHRQYFKEMTKLLGINVVYREPRDGVHYNGYGELEAFYKEPVIIGCIFDEHPTIWTMKKLGWNSELNESLSLIHVPYDLPNLQEGALFIIPSGIDNSIGRVFKVLRLSTISVYPASVCCEIGPVWDNTMQQSELNHQKNNFSILSDLDSDGLNYEEDEDDL